ncbi:MAG: hypothetical protein HY859_04470 [Caulobacterales bacterium]|nr:hypothetical protein [Caulobacterales bacterium]
MIVRTSALVAALLLSACASVPRTQPADQFLARLQALCGQRFAGRVATTDPADSAFAGKPLVMHVRDCTATEVRIPFSVGEDRSRTWVITRTAAGLRLKHDHRHPDGSEDTLSRYGGDTVATGAAGRQAFPADAFSRTLFLARGNPASIDNVWAMEIEPGVVFAYELRRPNRHFRVEFDLSKPL